ncbi:hypothetical protein [Poriferisphaera sp. WC338]|uniref:hypothetical protein n=1 Tax=Poriferisphaera sp. WC338 TaxID=3425129 RepID=UPI003D814819
MSVVEETAVQIDRTAIPSNQHLPATLIFKSPVIDPASQTFRCKFKINNNTKSQHPAEFNFRIVK